MKVKEGLRKVLISNLGNEGWPVSQMGHKRSTLVRWKGVKGKRREDELVWNLSSLGGVHKHPGQWLTRCNVQSTPDLRNQNVWQKQVSLKKQLLR